MYLTSFIHRNALFDIAERWFCNCPEPGDCQTLKKILICDGFVVHETLAALIRHLIDTTDHKPYRPKYIRSKGELRDIIYNDRRKAPPRVAELLQRYDENPDYYYREAPINAVVFLDDANHLLGSYRIKRPKRIAEKANRRIANWIYEKVVEQAKAMARERAKRHGIPLDRFITPEEQMIEEFIRAEELIAERFRDGGIKFEKTAMTIHDVGALKIVTDSDDLPRFEKDLLNVRDISIIEREEFRGKYRAVNCILEVPWNAEHVCRQYQTKEAWKRYTGRGILDEDLQKGLEVFLPDAETKINIELILTTFPDMVESEFGSSLHEERIIAQRDNKTYKGYIPMNVEFLVESLFAVGFSPRTDIDRPPIKLWGRYLPETMGSYIRQLHDMPEHDLIR
ncbi:MAG: hypothetical protein JXA41_03705 [Deltaproteobacteria bacterium]|nr:hypothetical protein [Deltaproteobacteria bacterium]